MTTDVKPCPHCDGEMVLVQDNLYHDWNRECTKCGYFVELLPRSNARSNRTSSFDNSIEEDMYANS